METFIFAVIMIFGFVNLIYYHKKEQLLGMIISVILAFMALHHMLEPMMTIKEYRKTMIEHGVAGWEYLEREPHKKPKPIFTIYTNEDRTNE
jgi:hypothetical protein